MRWPAVIVRTLGRGNIPDRVMKNHHQRSSTMTLFGKCAPSFMFHVGGLKWLVQLPIVAPLKSLLGVVGNSEGNREFLDTWASAATSVEIT